jgi:hypothetical protein
MMRLSIQFARERDDVGDVVVPCKKPDYWPGNEDRIPVMRPYAYLPLLPPCLVNWLLTMSSLPGNSILSGRSTWNFRCNIVSVSAHISYGMLADGWRAKQSNTGFRQNAKCWRKCARSLAPRALWLTRIGTNASQ